MLGSKDSVVYCTSDIYKQMFLFLSHSSDSVQGRRGSYFQAQALYLSLRTSYGVNTRQICSARIHVNTISKHCHAWVIFVKCR